MHYRYRACDACIDGVYSTPMLRSLSMILLRRDSACNLGLWRERIITPPRQTTKAYLLERPHLHAKLQASPSGVTNSADLDFPTAQEGFVVSRGGSSGGGFPPRGVTGGVGEGNERVTGTGIDEAGCSVDVSLEARSGERGGHANGNNSNGESNNNGSHRASYRNNGGNSSSIGNGSSTLNTSTDRSGGEHDAVSDDFTRMSATGFVEVLGRPDDVNAGSAWNIQRGGDDLDVAEWRPQRAITVKEGGDEAFLEGGDAGMTSSNSSLEVNAGDTESRFLLHSAWRKAARSQSAVSSPSNSSEFLWG